MKISILAHDLSENGLYRPYRLAQILKREYDVEIVGPQFGPKIYEPCDTGQFNYKVTSGSFFPSFFHSSWKILKSVTGNVIYANKLMIASYGISLLDKLYCKRPVVVDIDDWSLGHWLGGWNVSLFKKILFSYIRKPVDLLNPKTGLYRAAMEHLTSLADNITVTSDFLQQRFGGVKVPHGVDTKKFDPDKFNRKKLRREWNLDKKKIIMFFGNPAPYKGLEDVLCAINRLNNSNIKLMLVGANKDQLYVQKLLEFWSKEIIIVAGARPIHEAPMFLSMADLIVLAQQNTPNTIGQVPAKLIDAMAMAKPIISTNISDMPEILDGCGIIVEPGNVDELAESISYLIENPEIAMEFGQKAREKCKKRYSFDALQIVLREIFDKYT